MSILNFANAYALGVTVVNVPSATTIALTPKLGQMGWVLWAGTTGIELAGAGQSYAPAASSFTLIGGVTYSINFMNSNGSSLQLAANGSGIPIWNGVFEPMSIMGAAPLWITSAAGGSLRVGYLGNDAFLNT